MTPREKKFIAAYCQHLNGARAAREAKYSVTRAKVTASELLARPDIKEAVSQILDAQAMSTAEAIRRLTDMGRGDLSPFMTKEGDHYKLDISSAKARRAIGLIKKAEQKRFVVRDHDGNEIGTEQTLKIELHDAKDAIVKLLEVQGKIKGAGDNTTNVTIFQLPDNGR
ncbi:terminase small subunit [Spirosoma fluminis]